MFEKECHVKCLFYFVGFAFLVFHLVSEEQMGFLVDFICNCASDHSKNNLQLTHIAHTNKRLFEGNHF